MTYDHNGEQHYMRVKGVSNYVPTDATCTMFHLVYKVCLTDYTLTKSVHGNEKITQKYTKFCNINGPVDSIK